MRVIDHVQDLFQEFTRFIRDTLLDTGTYHVKFIISGHQRHAQRNLEKWQAKERTLGNDIGLRIKIKLTSVILTGPTRHQSLF